MKLSIKLSTFLSMKTKNNIMYSFNTLPGINIRVNQVKLVSIIYYFNFFRCDMRENEVLHSLFMSTYWSLSWESFPSFCHIIPYLKILNLDLKISSRRYVKKNKSV